MDNKIRIYFLYSCKTNEYPYLQDFRINYNKWLGLREEKISCSYKIPINLNNEYYLLLICFVIDNSIYKKLPNNFYIQLITDRSKYINVPLIFNDELKYNIDFFFQVQFYHEKNKNEGPPTYLNFSLNDEIDHYFNIKNTDLKFNEKYFLFALIDYFKNQIQNDLILYFTILRNIIEKKKMIYYFNFLNTILILIYIYKLI